MITVIFLEYEGLGRFGIRYQLCFDPFLCFMIDFQFKNEVFSLYLTTVSIYIPGQYCSKILETRRMIGFFFLIVQEIIFNRLKKNLGIYYLVTLWSFPIIKFCKINSAKQRQYSEYV